MNMFNTKYHHSKKILILIVLYNAGKKNCCISIFPAEYSYYLHYFNAVNINNHLHHIYSKNYYKVNYTVLAINDTTSWYFTILHS